MTQDPIDYASLSATIDRRSAVHTRIIASLAHMNRDVAMTIVMSWMSIEDLERAAKTICGRE